MTLQEFIRQHGDAEAARLFGVRVRTVASWRRGERYPRVEQAQNIVLASKGTITLDGIFGVRATSATHGEAEAA